jgi:hypothetical protein
VKDVCVCRRHGREGERIEAEVSLGKTLIVLLYHRVREAVAEGIIWLIHLIGANYMTDPMSKNLSGQEMWKILKSILFWKGETD